MTGPTREEVEALADCKYDDQHRYHHGAVVRELVEALQRARLLVPEFYVNWHHDTAAALAKIAQEGKP